MNFFLMGYGIAPILVPHLTIPALDRLHPCVHAQVTLIGISGHKTFPTLSTLVIFFTVLSMVLFDMPGEVEFCVKQFATLFTGKCRRGKGGPGASLS